MVELDADDPWGEGFDAGLTALMRGDLDAAADRFREVLRSEPHNGPAYLQLGRCEWRRGNVQAALDIFRHGLQAAGNSANLRAEVGMLFLLLGDERRAEIALSGARRMAVRNIRALQGLALLYVQREQWGKAIAMLQELLEVSPNNFAGHFLMAKVQEQLGNVPEASREWAQAEDMCREKLRHVEGQGATEYFLGEVLRAQYGWEKAREYFEHAASRGSVDEPYLFGLGLVVPWTAALEQAAAACAACDDNAAARQWTEKLQALREAEASRADRGEPAGTEPDMDDSDLT